MGKGVCTPFYHYRCVVSNSLSAVKYPLCHSPAGRSFSRPEIDRLRAHRMSRPSYRSMAHRTLAHVMESRTRLSILALWPKIDQCRPSTSQTDKLSTGDEPRALDTAQKGSTQPAEGLRGLRSDRNTKKKRRHSHRSQFDLKILIILLRKGFEFACGALVSADNDILAFRLDPRSLGWIPHSLSSSYFPRLYLQSSLIDA